MSLGAAVSSYRSNPPTEWAPDVVTIDAFVGIYAMPSPEAGNVLPTIWHWCTEDGRWQGWGTRDHTLEAAEPLHLEPSLLWPCCGLHGFIRDGKWVGA